MIYRKEFIVIFLASLLFNVESKIIAFDGDIDDRFGRAVSLSDEWFAIGANRDDDNGANSGSVYMYKYNGGDIVSEQKITAFDGDSNDYFGKSLSLHNDWLIVSALYDDVNGEKSGSAYVYNLIGDTWIFHSKLVPPDGSPFDRFGYSVDIHDNIIAISAVYDDDMALDAGSVYVYRLDNNIWHLDQKIYSEYASEGDFFGVCVSVIQDIIGVSAIYDEDIGSVTIFRYNQSWVEAQRIIPNDGDLYDFFGSSLDMFDDLLVVGSFHDNNSYNNSGSVYVYEISYQDFYNNILKIIPFDESTNDNFGQSVSIYDNYIAVGSNNDDNGINSGSVYIYNITNNVILNEIKYTPDDISHFDEFSGAVSLYNNNILVGAQYDDDLGESSGSAYLFTYKGCSQDLACNYDETFIADDDLCEYAENAFTCDGECYDIVDECGVCGGAGVSGDVNYDSQVNIVDIVLILEYIVGSNLYNLNECVCDMNFNYSINITDIILILDLILEF